MNIKLYKTLLAILCSLTSISTTASADVFDQVDQQKHLATTVYPTSVFDEAAARDMLINGSAVVNGVLSFIEPHYLPEHRKARDQSDGILFGPKKKRNLVANKQVILFPDSPYLREYLKLLETSKRKVDASDQFFRHTLKTKSNQFGEFSFNRLKPGKYYIFSEEMILRRQERVMVPDQYTYSYYNHRYIVFMEYKGFIEVKPGAESVKVDGRMMVRETQPAN